MRSKLVAHVVAATTSGALMGLLFGALGSLLSHDARAGAAVAMATVGAVFGIGELLGRAPPLPQWDRETPQRWLGHGGIPWALRNGFSLGVGLATRTGFGLWYVVPAAALVLASPAVGAAIWGAYGAVRAAGAPAILFAMMRKGPEPVMDWLAGRRPIARRVSGAVLAVVAVATVASAGTASAAVPVRGCSSGSERAAPDSDGATAGPFAFYDVDRIVRSRVRGRYLWKTPVWVAAGNRVRVAVARRDRNRARLVFSAPSNRVFPKGELAVRFRACESETGTAYPGSITTAPRARVLCLRLVVTDERSGRRYTLRLPLRRRCRGRP